jgi:hypothetical protein
LNTTDTAATHSLQSIHYRARIAQSYGRSQAYDLIFYPIPRFLQQKTNGQSVAQWQIAAVEGLNKKQNSVVNSSVCGFPSLSNGQKAGDDDDDDDDEKRGRNSRKHLFLAVCLCAVRRRRRYRIQKSAMFSHCYHL